MDVVRISSWNELNDRLYEGGWNPHLGRIRSNFIDRDMPDAEYPLVTTLQRLGHDHAGLEPHVLRSFWKYARREAVPDDSLWNWPAVAQHHGVPTRLLDWTYLPYAALHFVTAAMGRFGVNGIVGALTARKRIGGCLSRCGRSSMRRWPTCARRRCRSAPPVG